ncbi:YncE family protein, partial [Rhodococcus sp. WS4]
MVVTFLSVGACGRSGSDSAVDDAPPGRQTVTATVGAGQGPLLDVTVDGSTGTAYVTSSGDDSLSLIDADERVSTIGV